MTLLFISVHIFSSLLPALDSVGTRFDADFIEGDQADLADRAECVACFLFTQDDFDAPQLMSYTNDRDRSDRDRPSALDTASEAVPRLSKPPGTAREEDVDLL